MTEGQAEKTGPRDPSTIEKGFLGAFPLLVAYGLSLLKVPVWVVFAVAGVDLLLWLLLFSKPVRGRGLAAWRFVWSLRPTTHRHMERRVDWMRESTANLLDAQRFVHEREIKTCERRLSSSRLQIDELEATVARQEAAVKNAYENAELFLAAADSAKRERDDLRIRLSDSRGLEARVQDLRTQLTAVAERATKAEGEATAAKESARRQAKTDAARRRLVEQSGVDVTIPAARQNLGRGIAALLAADPALVQADDDGFIPAPRWIIREGSDLGQFLLENAVPGSVATRVRIEALSDLVVVMDAGYWKSLNGPATGAFSLRVDTRARARAESLRIEYTDEDGTDRWNDVPIQWWVDPRPTSYDGGTEF